MNFQPYLFFPVLVSVVQDPPARKNIVSEVSLAHCWIVGDAAQVLVQEEGQDTIEILLEVHLDEEGNFGVSAVDALIG